MKWLVISWLSSVFIMANGQLSSDTIFILQQVEKVETAVRKLEKIPISTRQNKSLTDALRENTGIYLKIYGNGQLGSISYRGTGASQTTLTWNGVKLNSPALGQVDVSLFNLGMFDQMFVNSTSHHGNVGGEIGLKSQLETDNGLHFQAVVSTGSFGTVKSLGKLFYGGPKVSGATRFSYLYSKNDYPFVNSYKQGKPKEKLTNAEVRLFNFMQQLIFRTNSNGVVSANFWVSQAERNIPPIISRRESRERQYDFSTRAIVQYSQPFGFGDMLWSTALFNDEIKYTNPESSIDDRSQINASRNFLRFRVTKLPKIIISTEAGYDFESASVPAYNGARYRHVGQLNIVVDYSPLSLLSMRATINEAIYNKEFSPFSGSLSIELNKKFKENHEISMGVSGARNYRFPTLNDLYWIPGGNAHLKTEKSWEAEGWTRYHFGNHVYMKGTWFIKWINDWIQWQSTGLYWTPSNVKNVFTRGFELTVKGMYSIKRFRIDVNANYTYTKATNQATISILDKTVKRQLIYVPEHMANVQLNLTYMEFFVRVSNVYNGDVFVTTDNSQKLNGFYLLDLTAGKDFYTKWGKVGMSFSVNNVMDKSYQQIAQRPMPGRNFEGTIHFTI